MAALRTMARFGWAFVLLLPVASACFAETEPAAVAKTNVLLISLDTLRADHISCYGYSRATTPNLDRFAAEGALFEQCMAASSWTLPTHMSIFTSLYPTMHGVDRATRRLAPGVPTLASVLNAQGYATAAFVVGPPMNRRSGMYKGFGLYDDVSAEQIPEVGASDAPRAEGHRTLRIVSNHTIARLASDWLRANADKPFFLFIHLWDIHHDYIPPEPYDTLFDPDYAGPEDGKAILTREPRIREQGIAPADLAHMVALYDGEIKHTDTYLGAILDLLEQLHVSDRTLVVVVADHGEEFLEHGGVLHSHTLFNELIHVPWIMRLPGVVPAGKRLAGLVSHVDILPTVLGLLRVPSPEGISGLDLTSCLLEGEPVPERAVFSDLNLSNKLSAIRWRDFKMIWNRVDDSFTLYQIAEGRDQPVVGEDEQLVELRNAMVDALKERPTVYDSAPIQSEDTEADRKLVEQLRSLGYAH